MVAKYSLTAPLAHDLFILWGDRFDEDVAAIFATEARRIGLCVKVVGLTGVQSVGGNGLVIAADLTLCQALPLATHAGCVVVPCRPAILQRMEDDPRVAEFFQEAATNQPLFVVNRMEAVTQSSLRHLTLSSDHLSFYNDYPNLITATRAIVNRLAAVAAPA